LGRDENSFTTDGVGDNGVLCCGVRDLGILALLGVAEAQSLGEVLKLQEPAKDERVGGDTRTKLDELYRQGGVYNGRRILDESFVSEATPSAEWRPAWLRLRLPLVGHADRDDAGLQRHRTVRPAGRCGAKPRASGGHLQWLLSAVALAGGAAVDRRNRHPAPTALGDESERSGCAA
jgi:hypothetical protein